MSVRTNILESLNEAKNIPSFPTIVIRLTEMLEDPDIGTFQIEELIKYDVAISSALLRLANTVAFNISGRVSSIEDAISRIGFGNISNLVLAISIIKVFSTNGYINYGQFWNHSLSVAYATQTIEKFGSKTCENYNDLYTAGLMHDLGVLIFDQFFPEEYGNVLIKAKESESPLHIIEQEVLGIDHTQVGEAVFRKWKLPVNIIEATRNIYRPHIPVGPASVLCKILHMANFACENQGIYNGIDAYPTEFSQSAWGDLGLTVEDIPQIIEHVNMQTAMAREIFKASSK